MSKPTNIQLKQAIDALFLKYDADKNNALDYTEIKKIMEDAFRNMNNRKSITDEDI